MNPFTSIFDHQYAQYDNYSELLEDEDIYIINNTYNEFLEDDYPYLNRIIEKYSLTNLIEENNEETPIAIIRYPEEKSLKFKITKKNKHGKEGTKNLLGKKIHSSTSNDNILCKMHIHFLKFLVNFANDVIKSAIDKKEGTKLKFAHIKHEIKIQMSITNLKKLMKKPINAILQLEISSKYRKLSLEKDYNKNVYKKAVALSDWLKKLFDLNYLDAFKLYYNDFQPLKIFEFEGKEIKISKNTESFCFLYNKEIIEEIKLKLKNIAKDYYLKLGN